MGENIKTQNIKIRTARKMTEQRLRNIALHYMERFGGTEKSVRDMLNRRLYKSLQDHPDQDREQINNWIDEIISTANRLGYIDDTAYAKRKVNALVRQGDSKKMITMKLKKKGITDMGIENAFEELDEDSEYKSAVAYTKKRKFGIYNSEPTEDQNVFNKQLASLARRGFSYSISRRALLGEE